MKWVRVFLLLMLAISIGLVASAQEGDDDGLDIETYDELQQSRTENGGFLLGDPDAPVTIIEFADYLCPACQRYHPTISEFIDTYVTTGEANFEYRFFPVIDQNFSPYLAAVTECAWDQDAFWGTYSLMYELASEQQIGNDILDVVIDTFDLDADALGECLATATQFEIDQQLGTELSVTGTPGMRVRVDGGPAGVLVMDGDLVMTGGFSPEMLAAFVESDDPATMISYEVGPQLLNEDFLPDTSLVSEDPCGAPCWNGITPGETAWEDAVAIIEADERLADVEVQSSPNAAQQAAFWSALDGDECCQMFSSIDGSVVDFLLVQTTPDMKFGDVVALYDEPQRLAFEIVTTITSGQIFAVTIFEDVPMIVYVFVAGEEGEISESSEVVGFAYISDELVEQLLADPTLLDWQGFATYAEYVGLDVEDADAPDAEATEEADE